MQTGLRSTQYQQYYDFGPSTLDCTARLIHQQQHVDQNNERTTFQTPVQIHHHQLHHSHHHHHHHQDHDHQHQQQLIEQPTVLDANFDHNSHQPHHLHHHHHQQQQQPIESHSYLNSDLQQRTDELTTPNGLNESLIVYQDQHQRSHHFQHINSIENNGNSTDNQSDTNQERRHEETADLETREPIYHQQGCVSIEQQQQQQQHGYQTIYYETVNFDGNCSIEARESNNQISEQQNQTGFVPNQLLPFINSSQPSDAECSVYFQYHQAHVENDETLLPSDLSESEIARSLNEQNQQQQHQRQQTSFYDQEQISVASKHQTQVYQTLETITNTFDLNDHNQQQQQQQHQQLNQQVELTLSNNDEQQQQQKFEQQTPQAGSVKPASPYQLHTNLHHHNHNNNHIQFNYIHSESTGAPTLTQSRNHSLTNTVSSHSSAASTTSSSESEESFASTLTRDEKRAREANIPLTYYQIVNLSIDQFNEQLAKHNLSESQLTLIKDIRRRGKNKVAAQSCRKRKMEQIYELQHEVNSLATKKRLLNCECSQLIKDHGNLVQEYNKIYTILQEKMQVSPQQNLQLSFQ